MFTGLVFSVVFVSGGSGSVRLHRLGCFGRTYRLRGFSRTTHILRVSRDALSRRVGRLRSRLSILLFSHVNGQVMPARTKLTFLPCTIETVHSTRGKGRVVHSLGNVRAKILRMKIACDVDPLLVTTLKLFSGACPGVGIGVDFNASRRLLSELRTGRLSFILSFGPRNISRRLRAVPLFSSVLHFVIRYSRPLTRLSSVALGQLSRAPLVLPKGKFTAQGEMSSLYQGRRLRLAMNIRVGSIRAVVRALHRNC